MVRFRRCDGVVRWCVCAWHVDTCSGGTRVTVYGQHFDSVAEPGITISVYVTTYNNVTNNDTLTIFTDSQVTPLPTYIKAVKYSLGGYMPSRSTF